MLPHCSIIERKQKKTIDEMEQEFLQVRPKPASTPHFSPLLLIPGGELN